MAVLPIEIVSADARSLGRRSLHEILLLVVLCGCAYGAIMGMYGGLGISRWEQILYSAVKVPLLLMVTFTLCLPSFFVLNTLLGLRDDFTVVLRALVLTQAGLTVILLSLAPYTAFWYINFEPYRIAILFNGLMFAIASLAAQLILIRLYRPLIVRNVRHRFMLVVWLVQYTFVGIQMGWVLRPFIGHPTMPTEFFREDSWTNAYVVIAQMIWDVLGG